MSSIIKGITDEQSVIKTEPQVQVPGYGTMPLDMLKRHVQSLSKDFNDSIQQGEFLKAAYRTEQFYNALMALAKALKQQDVSETTSTGTTAGSAGIGGGVGLGIDKSPIEKVLEKPFGESVETDGDKNYKQALKDLQYFVDFIKYNSKTTSNLLKNMGPINPGQSIIKKALTACDDIIKIFTVQKNQNIVSAISNIKNEIKQWYSDGNKPLENLMKGSLSKISFPKENTTEDTAYATGMGQGGDAGEARRKYTPKAAGLDEEQAPMFTPEEKMVNANDPRSDGWRLYKTKPAGTKESAVMKGIQAEGAITRWSKENPPPPELLLNTLIQILMNPENKKSPQDLISLWNEKYGLKHTLGGLRQYAQNDYKKAELSKALTKAALAYESSEGK
jgi:hypothetical protein